MQKNDGFINDLLLLLILCMLCVLAYVVQKPLQSMASDVHKASKQIEELR